MDSVYQRRLLMLQGQNGQTGFVNLERKQNRLTFKFQVAGLPRGASDVHGQLVSLRQKKKVDCGRLRVDMKGQGGLLKELEMRDMDGLSLEACDCVVVTSGGQALMAGALSDKPVDWEALRGFLYALRPKPKAPDVPERRRESASNVRKQPEVLSQMSPNTPENLYAASAPDLALDSPEPPQPQAEGEEQEPAPETEGADWLTKAADALDANDRARMEQDYANWPAWKDVNRPALEWPEEAEDLRVLFERGEPYSQIDLPGWYFVRVPGANTDKESILGALEKDGRVVQTACLFQGEEAPEPPPGLDGYVYARDIGDGYWTQWRDYAYAEEHPVTG